MSIINEFFDVMIYSVIRVIPIIAGMLGITNLDLILTKLEAIEDQLDMLLSRQ